jgi:flavin reductase (DIM6/NTAB) family NADH-FMN oxidoreductase RutF
MEQASNIDGGMNKISIENTDTKNDKENKDESLEFADHHVSARVVPAKLREGVRNVMRKVPASVAVITVASFAGEKPRPVPMGVAVSSFTTVSLDPPLVSFNLKKPSQTLDAIRKANGRFRAHFLQADREGARIIELFCNGNHAKAYDEREKSLNLRMPVKDKTLPPQILDDAVQAALNCSVIQGMSTGDHVILVARVNGVDPCKTQDPAISYVDGKYMRMDGKIVSSHGTPVTAEKGWSPYDYPFLPGKAEQEDYVKRLENMFKANPGFLDKRPYEIRQALQGGLALTPNHFGINMDLLFANLKQKAGRKALPDSTYSSDMPVMAEFYGSLSQAQKTRVVNRAIEMVKADPRCIAYVSYRKFLGNLGVGANCNITPSDIMVPLREAGLVGRFRRRMGEQKDEDAIFSIEYLEQTEANVRTYLAQRRYSVAERLRFSKILSAVGEPPSILYEFNRIQDRLRCEAAPKLYDVPEIDLRGDLTPEEVRVAIRRIVRDLKLQTPATFRTQSEVRDRDRMVRVGIHPMVSGIDVPFILGKIKHIYNSTPYFSNFRTALEASLEGMFTNSVTRAELGTRVQDLVSKHTLRAMSWPAPDLLAAMGLRQNATIAPDASNIISSASVNMKREPIAGVVLDTLVATELRRRYGSGTPEEDYAIADFLRERYGFDVERNAPVEVEPVNKEGSELLEKLDTKMKAEAQEMTDEEISEIMGQIEAEKARLKQMNEVDQEAPQVEKVIKKQSGLEALDELERAAKQAEEGDRRMRQPNSYDPVAPVVQRPLDPLEKLVQKQDEEERLSKKWSVHRLPSAGGGGGSL